MRQKSESKNQLFKAFGAFGFKATPRPSNAKYREEGLKTRIDGSFRDKDGAFKTTTYFLSAKLAAPIE